MPRYRMNLLVCTGTGCVSNGAFEILEAIERELEKHNLQDEIGIVTTGRVGAHGRTTELVYAAQDIRGNTAGQAGIRIRDTAPLHAATH